MCVPRAALLLQVADQLCAKYSKEYGKLCRTNQIGTVNDRVMELSEKTHLLWRSSPFPMANGWCLWLTERQGEPMVLPGGCL